MDAGTIVTSAYLPWARVLAASYAAHHPGARMTVLLLDGPAPAPSRKDDAFRVVRPSDIGLTATELGWLETIYDAFELCCALKPLLLRHILADADAALYLDSDILVCGSLAALGARAAATGVVLTPHLLEPLPEDGLMPDEDVFLRDGQFNGGFVAVGPRGGPFLEWWAARLRRECLMRTPEQPLRFVDQRWLDRALSYFEVDIARDRGANVAYWNLPTRRLARVGDAYTVDGDPLLFLHFSGFDPTRPEILSRHAGEPPRVRLAAEPALAGLCCDYATALRDAGWTPASGAAPPRRLGVLTLTPIVRSAVRCALADAERTAPETVPEPGDADAVLAWLRAPVTAVGTPRYLAGLSAAHPAVRAAFGAVPGGEEAALQRWATGEGVRLGLVPEAFCEAPAVAAGSPPAPTAPAPDAPVEPRERGIGNRAAAGLGDASGFLTLCFAADVLADPRLLSAYAEHFGDEDDATLVIYAPAVDVEEAGLTLAALVERLGLDGPDSPDMIAMPYPTQAPDESLLAASVDAVLSLQPPRGSFAGLPWAVPGSLSSLRRRADEARATSEAAHV